MGPVVCEPFLAGIVDQLCIRLHTHSIVTNQDSNVTLIFVATSTLTVCLLQQTTLAQQQTSCHYHCYCFYYMDYTVDGIYSIILYLMLLIHLPNGKLVKG